MTTAGAQQQVDDIGETDDISETIVDQALDCLMTQIEQEAVPLPLIELGAAVENQLTSMMRQPPPASHYVPDNDRR
jgi:hypothetical protein